jgi:putative IMPACT (imprinted ancient) family translation regulator
MFSEAKKNRVNDVKWSLDKLFINGTCHTAHDDQADFDPALADNDIDIKHTDHVVLNGSTFMGHCAPIGVKDDVSSVMATLLQDTAVAKATHNIYAYRVRERNKIVEGQKDDGEHGAGHHILQLMREQKVENCMIVVTRWYGGQNLGPQRFDCIVNSARSALHMRHSE